MMRTMPILASLLGRIFRSGTPEQLGNDPEVKRVYLGESFSLV